MVSASVAGALSARLGAPPITLMPAGTPEESVTVPLKPLIGAKASVLMPVPLGEIWISAFCVVREKSGWATVISTALEAAAV